MALKKIKISSILTLLFILFISIFLSACNKTVSNFGKVKLDISEDYKKYIKGEIPSFTLYFDGTLNTIENVNKSYYTVFSGNDDIILSNALSDLFLEYKDKMEVEVRDTKISKTREFSTIEDGKVKNINMVLDEEKSYNEVAFIPLSNGLKLTIDYCRFVSEGKTYYTWCYERSISMYLYYPVMVINNNEEKEICILTLPNKVKIHVTPELKLENILKKENYIKSTYYTFEYAKGNTIDEKKEYVWSYYEDYNLSERSDEFTFIYLNNKFKVKLNEENFTLTWDGRYNG